MAKSYRIEICVEIEDHDALRAEAFKIAKAAGISEDEFTFYEKQGSAPEFYLGWLFDHASPLHAGVQIQQTDVVEN